jgi:acyl-CoA synthetase (AMP-forming)/AMP-acid ligase II
MGLVPALKTAAGDDPYRLAIVSDTRDDARSYADLLQLCEDAEAFRHGHCVQVGGIGLFASDPLEQAEMLFALAASGAVFPLNPGMGERELARVLDARALGHLACPERDAGTLSALLDQQGELVSVGSRKLCVFEVAERSTLPRPLERPVAQKEALILATSGTTAAPKIVIHTQAALVDAARAVASTFSLTPDDCTVNPMPLSHIHGLSVCLFSTLLSGGRVILPAPRDPASFLEACVSHGATWFSAVPTFHHALVSMGDDSRRSACRFRFIRSASTALPENTRLGLESAFGAPVLEGYGMTEGCGFISQQTVATPSAHGSLGRAQGVEVVSLDPQGAPLPAGEKGILALRGDRIITAYAGGAGAENFVNGYLLTGDVGTVDDAGDVRIFGRRKEIINRGGFTISPYTVEDALLALDGVSEAAAFPVEHPTLGQDLQAAVTLRAGTEVTEAQLKADLRGRESGHLVPSRIAILDALPKGESGKIQRAALPDVLARLSPPEDSEPANDVELVVLLVCQDMLESPALGRGDDFFRAGGDSLSGMRLLGELAELFDLPPALETLFHFPTAEMLGAHIVEMRGQAAFDAVERLRSATLEDVRR